MSAPETIAISISEPEDAELAARGLSSDHVNHTYVELARQILATGRSVAYGGNPLRESRQNYVDVLLALLRTYSTDDRPPRDRIVNYIAAHVWEELTTADRAKLAGYLTLRHCEPAGPEARKSANYTAMRTAMAAETDARIILGGRLAGSKRRWPGTVEEAFLTLRAGKPLFIVGGLGGAASVLADLVRRREPSQAEFAGMPALRDAFAGVDLRNGLSCEENQTLFDTADLDLIVALVLRGLGGVHRAPVGR